MPTSPRRRYKEVRLQQLRGFCAAARHLNFSAAARELGISQPTICLQVQDLERAFGARFFLRHGPRVQLTAEGQMLLELAQPAVTAVDALPRAFAERCGDLHKRLTVATTPGVLLDELPEVVAEFRRQFRAVRLAFRTGEYGEVRRLIEAGEADLGLLAYPEGTAPRPALEYEVAYELDFLLMAPAGHALVKKQTIRPADLVRQPLLLGPPGNRARDRVDEALRQAGLLERADVVIEVGLVAAVEEYVRHGLGVGVLIGHPALMRRRYPGVFLHSMTRHFGRAPFAFVRRRGAPALEAVRNFEAVVKRILGVNENRRRTQSAGL